MNKWPDLMFYNIACAKNGGPIAFMIKDNVLFIGQKEIKSIIFIFTAFGKFLRTINVNIFAYLVDGRKNQCSFTFLISYFRQVKMGNFCIYCRRGLVLDQ